MDTLQKLRQQKAELNANKNNIEEQKRFSMPNPQEIKLEPDIDDDLYFECNIPELKERLNNALTDPDADIAMEMQSRKSESNVFDLDMIKKTREAVAPDPDAPEAPEKTLLKEEKKSEVPVNVIDLKNAEKQLDLTKLTEGEKQQKEPVQKKKEKKAAEDHSLPEQLKATLQSIVNDKRGASKYYSAVQEAAKKLLSLDLNVKENSKAINSSMAELMNAAILYRDKRPGGRFLRKGRERARWMDSLIDGMKDYTLEKEPVYMYNITKEWQENVMDENGYPEHLAKWMKKEAEKIPSTDPEKKFEVSEYTFVRYAALKSRHMKKHLSDDAGWNEGIKESHTNDQYSRVAPLISDYGFHDFHSDGTAANEETEKWISSEQERISAIKSPVPAERAKALDPIIQRFLDMKFTPEMMTPGYYLKHIHEFSELQDALTLYQNLFTSDEVNAAYLKSLPSSVQSRLQYFYDCVYNFSFCFSLMGNSSAVSESSFLQENDRSKEIIADGKEYAPYIKLLSDALKDEKKSFKLVEYKKGMRVQKGTHYYVKNKVEGMPEDAFIADNALKQAVMDQIAALNLTIANYKSFLEEKIDVSEEKKKQGTGVNDELVKDVVLPKDCQSNISAEQQTAFWKKIKDGIGPDSSKWDSGSVDNHINIRKGVSIRNEKLRKVLDTNGELTRDQVISLENEISANMELIRSETEMLENAMEYTVYQICKQMYFEAHKEEGRAAVPKANEAGDKGLEEFLKQRENFYIPPKEETEEERDQRTNAFIARQKKQNPDFEEDWGKLIFLDNERQTRDRQVILDSDHKSILKKYTDDVKGGLTIGNIDREFLMAILKRVNYTPSGEFATKEDFEAWKKNRRLIKALKAKDDEVLTTEVKNYLYELFNTIPEATEDMTGSEYSLKHPEEIASTPFRLYYTNVVQSEIPAVKKAVEEFNKEQPEASEWLNDRLDLHEEFFFMGHSLINGYKDTAASYDKRFKGEVEEKEKVNARSLMEFQTEVFREGLKIQKKKPALK